MSPFKSHNLNLNHSKHTFDPLYAKLGVGSARQIVAQLHPLPGIHSQESSHAPLKLTAYTK